MELARKKKDLPEVTVRMVMSLYHEQKRKFEWDVSYLKNSEYKWIYIKNLDVDTAFCTCSGCILGKCKRRINE